MPVLVTGAESGLGARVVDRVLATGGEARAFVDGVVVTDDHVAALRRRGCKVAVGELDDEGHLETALAQAHTVVHCWGDPGSPTGPLVDAAAALASAALGAGVARLIWVHELGADPGNPRLVAQRRIAALFEELPLETVGIATAVRVGHDDQLTRRLRGGWLSGSGARADARHAPVGIDDVAGAILVADGARGGASEAHLRLGLVGPETLTLAALLARLGAPPLSARRPATMPAPPSWVVDWLSGDVDGADDPGPSTGDLVRTVGGLPS